MPIEVRELVIKATVQQSNSTGSSGASGGANNNNVSGNQEIINLCVEKILEILKHRNER